MSSLHFVSGAHKLYAFPPRQSSEKNHGTDKYVKIVKIPYIGKGVFALLEWWNSLSYKKPGNMAYVRNIGLRPTHAKISIETKYSTPRTPLGQMLLHYCGAGWNVQCAAWVLSCLYVLA